MLYLTDRDRDPPLRSFEERHAVLATEHTRLLRALDFEGVSTDERNRRIAAMKELVNDAQTWLDYVRSLPPEVASHLMQNVTPQDLVRILSCSINGRPTAWKPSLQKLGGRDWPTSLTWNASARQERARSGRCDAGRRERPVDVRTRLRRRTATASHQRIGPHHRQRTLRLDVADTITQRPDIVARSRSQLSLQPNHQWQDGEEGTLLLELKNAGKEIGTADQTQASSYIRQLVRTGALPEREPVDCYVIGGGVHDHEGGPRIEGWYHNVRITSLSYDNLIERAKCLTLGVYDQIKDVAPFLAAARHSAPPEAANESLPLAAE